MRKTKRKTAKTAKTAKTETTETRTEREAPEPVDLETVRSERKEQIIDAHGGSAPSRRGGARPGAGRKPRKAAPISPETVTRALISAHEAAFTIAGGFMGRDIAKPDVQSALRGVSRGAGETASLALQGFSDDGSASPYTLLALYACSLIGGGFVVYSLPKLERDEPEPPSAVPPSSAERARGGGTTRVSDLPVR